MKTLITKSIGLYLNVLATVAPNTAGALGFKIFCFPVRMKISKRQHEFLQSAHQFKLTHRGETIQGYRWGNGPKNILLLHGWQSHSYRWKRYVETIDKNLYTIYAIDAPGHGLSSGKFMTVPVYSEVITQVVEHIGKVDVVIGHSLGSFTALYTFHNNPQLLPGKLIATAPPAEAKEFFNFYQTQLSLTPRCMDLIIKRFEIEVKHPPAYFSAPAFSKHLTVPGLIIHDQDDEETPVENAVSIHRSWKNSTLILTKGNGHNLKSPEVVEHVMNFIKQEPVYQEAERKG